MTYGSRVMHKNNCWKSGGNKSRQANILALTKTPYLIYFQLWINVCVIDLPILFRGSWSLWYVGYVCDYLKGPPFPLFQVALSTFATYVLSSSSNVFTAERAFVSLSLLNILRFPLFMIPTLLSNIVQVSLIF